MNDFLKEICQELDLKLVYTNNKYTVLSFGINNNSPIIRVHKIYNNCPEQVARAIIGFYLDFQNRNKHLKIIEDYTKEHFGSSKYHIKVPNQEFNDLLPKSENATLATNDEFKILTIIKKDFWGNISKIKPEETISTITNDVLQLDIIVEDSGE